MKRMKVAQIIINQILNKRNQGNQNQEVVKMMIQAKKKVKSKMKLRVRANLKYHKNPIKLRQKVQKNSSNKIRQKNRVNKR